MSFDTGTVVVTTRLGARYEYPDVFRDHLAVMVPYRCIGIPERMELLSLYNASEAFLAVPFRIIQTITYKGEEWWTNPKGPVAA